MSSWTRLFKVRTAAASSIARARQEPGNLLANSEEMRILVSNDDGIYSPGIAALAEVAAELGSVRIVAPDVERSSAGHSITASRPLAYRLTKIGMFEAYRVNGTPADCVALGTHHWENVDIVLSGFNQGLNLGNSIWHSGTVAAAKQAVLLGIRGVALSMPSGIEHHLRFVQTVGTPRPADALRRIRSAAREREFSP